MTKEQEASENAKVSGWYYDLQMENKLTCVTLHPNQVPDGVKWKDVPDPDPDDETKPQYSLTPICSAIVNEDFNVSIANSWSDFGGDPIGSLWDQAKPLAPYADTFVKGLGTIIESQNNMSEEEKQRVDGSKAATAMRKISEKLYDMSKKGGGDGGIVDYLNRSLVVQGTRFSYYSGTGVSFGNLSMKFTVFPTWKDKTFITVNNQINALYPYLVGKFVKEDALKGDLKDFIGWQKPPGGFQANIKDVDNVQKGTLKLKFGAYYSITNLVCQDATFNFSRQMVKNPKESQTDPNIPSSIISPLYCDVSITLRPATKFSDESLRAFVTGKGRLKCIDETNGTLKGALSSEKGRMAQYLAKYKELNAK